MKYRDFGSTGFKVSALGLGCMRLPTVRFVPGRVDTKKAVRLIHSAIDQGINYIDTAWPYHFGGSEKVLGTALQDGYRDRVHLTTKLFMPLTRKPEDFDRFLSTQLERLQTEYIDTYLFHSLNKSGLEKIKSLKLIDKMLEARDNGKIKYIGFSFHDSLPVFKEIVDLFAWDVVQIQYNYMDTTTQATAEGLKYAADKGIAIVAMEPVRGGQLANPPVEAKSVMATAAIHRSPVDWALQFLWNLPEISVVLSGMGNQRMLDENCASADKAGVGSLTADDLRTIDELVKIYRAKNAVPCTACQYCMNCPSGVNIPENFAAVNNAALTTSVWQQWLLKHSYKKLVKKPEQLNKEKTNGRAMLCTECGICIAKCPQGIQIPDELKKVTEVMEHGRTVDAVFKGSAR